MMNDGAYWTRRKSWQGMIYLSQEFQILNECETEKRIGIEGLKSIFQSRNTIQQASVHSPGFHPQTTKQTNITEK